jgi:signal recognition particle subunit SRP54
VRYLTGKPIKFIGVGEKTTALEPFYPDRVASRIIGHGDVLSLIEDVERKVDKQKAEQLAKKMEKGKSFDLEDFRMQLQEMRKVGSLSGIMDKMPGMSQVPDQVKNQIDDKMIIHMEAIINSMTPHERKFPDVIRASRKVRIAKGSGMEVQDVNRLLKQFGQMQKMMKQMHKKGGLMKMMRSMKGKMPSGGMF